jgi:DNA-binding transcriptional regulator GbsR (MarR family)
MRIDELCSKLGKSRSTIEKRIKKLTPEQIDVIRVAVSNGKLHHYEYNDKALTLLQSEQNVQSDNTISKSEHLQELLDNANDQISELKTIIKELKEEKQQIQQHQQNIENAYSDSTKYIQSLLENQQKITMDLQQKLKLPAPKKKGWF